MYVRTLKYKNIEVLFSTNLNFFFKKKNSTLPISFIQTINLAIQSEKEGASREDKMKRKNV